MLKTCGKSVQILCKNARKTCRESSTSRYVKDITRKAARVKVLFIHHFVHMNYPQLSPPIFTFSPLGEHYFYPVSTAPINISTKGN